MFCVKSSSTVFRHQNQIVYILRSLATQANLKVTTEEVSSSAHESEWLSARPYSEIPRQTKLDFIRSYLPGGRFQNTSATETALILKEELGEIFVVPGIFGRSDILMLLNPDHIEKVYRTEGIWPVRDGFETVAYFRNVLKKDFFGENSGLVVAQGESWGRQRKVINPVIVQPRNVKLYINSLVDINDEFVQRIRDVRDPNTKEVPKNFEEDLNRLTFESITSIALNQSFGLIRRQKENPDALRMFKNVRDFFIYIFELEMKPSMWKTVSTPTFKKMMKCQEEIFEVTSKFVSDAMIELERKKSSGDTVSENQEPSVLEKLLKIDKKVAIIMTMDMLLAGVDATSTVLAGLLLTLAKNPAKQALLREEVLKIMPNKDTPLTVESMKNMPYLRACIKESMRFYPVASGNFRTAGRDIVLGGYRIPKGTNAILNSSLMLLNENYYSRPNEYIPERWMRNNTSNEILQDNSHPFSFLPFGFGPRICVGKRIVEIELEVCITKLIRNFHIEYNYPTENAFKQYFINILAIPLNLKFTDVME